MENKTDVRLNEFKELISGVILAVILLMTWKLLFGGAVPEILGIMSVKTAAMIIFGLLTSYFFSLAYNKVEGRNIFISGVLLTFFVIIFVQTFEMALATPANLMLLAFVFVFMVFSADWIR